MLFIELAPRDDSWSLTAKYRFLNICAPHHQHFTLENDGMVCFRYRYHIVWLHKMEFVSISISLKRNLCADYTVVCHKGHSDSGATLHLQSYFSSFHMWQNWCFLISVNSTKLQRGHNLVLNLSSPGSSILQASYFWTCEKFEFISITCINHQLQQLL